MATAADVTMAQLTLDPYENGVCTSYVFHTYLALAATP